MSHSKPPTVLGLAPALAVALLLAVSFVSRLVIATTIPILPDESYYFQWSKHLDASYFSKGPAIAWTIWLGTQMFGGTLLGIRFFSVALSVGTAWQLFLLARTWFDEITGLIAVLIISVIPLYAIGAVVMTIDPLTAFFWVWAANLFTTAWQTGRSSYWALTGFAIGAGFLAKYLNALELLAFLIFCISTKPRGTASATRLTLNFALMLVVFLVSIIPVLWWNSLHDWPTVKHLTTRGDLQHSDVFNPESLFEFLWKQALLSISPLLFILLLCVAVDATVRWRHISEATRLCVILFYSVFLFYFILAFHIVGEPNWPSISYLTLVIVFASYLRPLHVSTEHRLGTMTKIAVSSAFLLALFMVIAIHSTRLIPFLSKNTDPFSRTAGWAELAADIQTYRLASGHPEMLTDAYKEAAIVTFYLPDQHPVYCLRSTPPASQYDFWPAIPEDSGTGILYFTEDPTAQRIAGNYRQIQLLHHFYLTYRGKQLRSYYLFLIKK